MSNVILLKYEDWEGLYLNGKCVRQDHRILPMDMLLDIKIHFPGDTKLNDLIPDVWYADEEWAEEAGEFPYDWNDVKVRF